MRRRIPGNFASTPKNLLSFEHEQLEGPYKIGEAYPASLGDRECDGTDAG